MNALLAKYLQEMATGGADMPPAWQQGASVQPEAPAPAPQPDLMAYFRAIRPELFSQEAVGSAMESDAATNARNAGLRRMESGAAGYGLRNPNYAGMEPTDAGMKGLQARQQQAMLSAEVGSKVGQFRSAADAGDPTSAASLFAYKAAMNDPYIGPRLRAMGGPGQVSKAQIDQIVATAKTGGDLGKDAAAIVKDTAAGASSQAEADTKNALRPGAVEAQGYTNKDLALKPAATAASTAKTQAETKKIGVETAGMEANPPGKVKLTEQEAALRKEFTAQPAVVAMAQIGPMRAIVNSTAPDGPGDMSMLYAFMKMIDPGSAVREGEFANASNSGGIPDAIRIAYNRAIQGDKLSDDMRAKFRAEANNVYAKRLEAYKATAESYGRLATEQGADPARVVVDLGYAAAPVTNPGAGLTTLRPK